MQGIPLSAQNPHNYLSRVRDLAARSDLDGVTAALSKPAAGRNSTETYLVTEDNRSAQTLNLKSPAQILSAVTENLARSRRSVCIVENISPEFIEVLGSAWDIDPAFFVQHAANPRRGDLWLSRWFEPGTNEAKFGFVDGNFEYHGISLSDDEELNSLPNHFERHCFRSTWEGVETINSNTRISYYRVEESFYLFLVDAPLDIQKWYDDTSRQLRPSLRLPYAHNRGGLQLQPLFELREKKGIPYSLTEILKSVFLHGWQRQVLFSETHGMAAEGAAAIPHAALPAHPLCYLLSNSICQSNLRYLSREIKRISFQEIRDPKPSTNEILHDRREDLVAFFKAGLVETIRYMPKNVEKYMEDFHRPDQEWIGYMTGAHRMTLDEALELERFLIETFQLLMSSISVQDAKASIVQSQLNHQQSLRTTQLTVLASIYVPLSFVTGIFGMNMKEFNGSRLSIWVFVVTIVVAVMVTAVIFCVLQMRSKQKDIVKVDRKGEVDKVKVDTMKKRGRVFAMNGTIEKSMA